MSIREQLYKTIHNPKKGEAFEYIERFKEVIQEFENKIRENGKRDILFQNIVKVIHKLKDTDFTI